MYSWRSAQLIKGQGQIYSFSFVHNLPYEAASRVVPVLPTSHSHCHGEPLIVSFYFYDLLNNSARSSGCIASNYRMVNAWWPTRRAVEVSGHVLSQGTPPILAWKLWGKPRRNCQNIRCLGRDLNRAPPVYKSEALKPKPACSVWDFYTFLENSSLF
jgi:hypothetical protein